MHCISSINEDLDSSLLNGSTDIIDETPKKKLSSPKSFAEDNVKHLAIVTPGRVDATGSSNHNVAGVVSLPEVTRRAISDILREPLWKVLKEKAKCQNKQAYLNNLENNAIPKGVTPNVPLRIVNPPQELLSKWDEILNVCRTSFTRALS